MNGRAYKAQLARMPQGRPFFLDRFLGFLTPSRCSPLEGVLLPLDVSALMPSI